MGDEEFVDVKYSSGLSSRDSFVMEPAESSPVINSQAVESDKEIEKPTEVAANADLTMAQLGADADSVTNPQSGSWSSWGNALFSVASSSVKALEQGVAKVLDVIEDNGGKDEPPTSPLKHEAHPVDAKANEGSTLPLPSGVKDDLRTLSSAVQRTSGKLMTSGFGMLSALGRKTLEVLVAEGDGQDTSTKTDSSLSSRLREAKAVSVLHEKEQKRQLSYWFDLSGGNDSFEAFRCFSQSSIHSIHGKIECCKVQTGGDENIVPETYKRIAEIFSSSSDRLIKAWDSSDFNDNGDLLDCVALAKLLKEKLPQLTAPTDRLCSALEIAKKDLLITETNEDQAFESALSHLAYFTAAVIDYLHKSVQLLHASALSAKSVQSQPGKESFIRSECAAILEIAAAFSTACILLAERIRAISVAGKSTIMKNAAQASVQPDDETSPEMAATSLEMEATDCAAHLAKMLGLLGPVVQHLLLLRLYGADCRPVASIQDDEDDK